MHSLLERVLNGSDLYKIILSHVLDPLVMSTLCAVAKSWEGHCFDKASWLDTVVDVPPWYKPSGLVAWNHFQSWTLAKYVVVRPWMFRYCGLLMHSSVQPWQWLKPRPVLHNIPAATSSCDIPDLKDTMWRRCCGKWLRVGTPAPLCDVQVRLHFYEDPTPDLCFGIANTRDVCELTALMTNQFASCGLLGRDSELTEIDKFEYYYCAIRSGIVSFYWNSRMLCEVPCPYIQRSVVIKFGVVDSKVFVSIYDLLFETALPTDGICAEDYYFPVLIVDGNEWPQDYVCLPFAEPLLSRKGGTKR